jgi:hypothetical protein
LQLQQKQHAKFVKEVLMTCMALMVPDIAQQLCSRMPSPALQRPIDPLSDALPASGMRKASAVQQLASSLGPAVAGKVVIDATNPLTPYPGLEVLWDGTSGEFYNGVPTPCWVEHEL